MVDLAIPMGAMVRCWAFYCVSGKCHSVLQLLLFQGPCLATISMIEANSSFCLYQDGCHGDPREEVFEHTTLSPPGEVGFDLL